nr:immunoglobulin light chain junction region [Macaca mulatta]MOW03980.1 immunoglobulin light chain junction region [Macaca mulatta]MOW03997.1 immunoglobulin light chain junction region [Macaca mulatta]MOW04046.1 immunoglobulin light chain junction region [Macaca mulatta]MOW04058.1 immunoglobulin light chain junction region [Macaca mulatta]
DYYCLLYYSGAGLF